MKCDHNPTPYTTLLPVMARRWLHPVLSWVTHTLDNNPLISCGVVNTCWSWSFDSLSGGLPHCPCWFEPQQNTCPEAKQTCCWFDFILIHQTQCFIFINTLPCAQLFHLLNKCYRVEVFFGNSCVHPFTAINSCWPAPNSFMALLCTGTSKVLGGGEVAQFQFSFSQAFIVMISVT